MAQYFRRWLVLTILIAAACSQHLSITFELPREEIQQKLSQKFPLKPGSAEKEKSPLEMTLSNPEVLLEEGKNQIGLRVNLEAEPAATGAPAKSLPQLPANRAKPAPALNAAPTPPKPHFTGTATIFANVSYDPNLKAIHLSDAKITNLQIAQLPDQMSEPLKRIAEQAINQKFAEQPIPLEDKTKLDQTVKTFLKSVTVKNGKLLVEVGW